jgi:hypothetical protein
MVEASVVLSSAFFGITRAYEKSAMVMSGQQSKQRIQEKADEEMKAKMDIQVLRERTTHGAEAGSKDFALILVASSARKRRLSFAPAVLHLTKIKLTTTNVKILNG